MSTAARQGSRASVSPAPRAAMLRWAAGLGAVTAPALAEAQDAPPAVARGRLAAACRAGQLLANRPLAGRPTVYTVTRAGLRACGATHLRPARVTPANAEHASACALVAARLARFYPDRVAVGEPEVRLLQRGPRSPVATLSQTGPGRASTHRPDLLLLRPGDGSAPVAVEVELTCKSALRLRAICLAWARCRQVAGVLYVAGDGALAALERAIADADAGDRVLVVPLSRLVAGSSPFARAIPGDA